MATLDTTRQRIREARLRSLVSLSPAAMVVTDTVGRYVDANPAASKALGAPREAILTRAVDAFTSTANGFDLDSVWEQFLREGRMNGVWPGVRLDGTLVPLLFAATAELVPGLCMGVFTAGNGVSPHPAPGDGASLTPREREVLRLIADGHTDRQIADALVLAPSTARTHTRNLLEKLDARTRAQAVAIAIRSGDLSL